jgi:hypothetical protein
MPGPAECNEPIQHCSAKCAGQVMAANAPVQTRQAQWPAPVFQSVHIDLHIASKLLALLSERDAGVVRPKKFALNETIEYKDPEVTCKMIVANARLS